VLYNAMLRPLAPFALRGFLWYQGESNAGRAYQYRALFPALIRDWRSTWGGPELPFYFVQLANFMRRQPEPGPSDWAELREAQAMALALPATGMAVTIDIGAADDIHPRNKVEVGNRLARHALNRVYGKPMADSGPVLRAWSAGAGRMLLEFEAVAGGLEAKGGALHGFEVAGADREFHRAEARISAGDRVEVWSDAVAEPVAVRYGWANNPLVTLFDGAGLPASPFRTDDWPGITAPRE
jgi:sialate O-acetylesterase